MGRKSEKSYETLELCSDPPSGLGESKVGQWRTKTGNIFYWWHIYTFYWNAICHPTTPNKGALNVTVPLRWPSFLTYIMRVKRWIQQFFKHLISTAIEECDTLKEKSFLIFMFFHHWPFETYRHLNGDLSASRGSSYSVCFLMASCQCVQSGVDCANENVSQPHVLH